MKIYEKIPFFDENKGGEPYITPYLSEGENNCCVIVCPGGGYEVLAEHEEYHEFFNRLGLSVFVLNYRLKPYSYPCQFLDVQRAVRFVRFNAERLRINPEKILIAGSSAGGHLSACAWCFGDDGKENGDEIDKVSLKVAGAVLCYPVISLVEHTHQGSSDNFSGGDDEIRERFSVQKQIKSGLSPVFLWHTVTDKTVDVENSLMLAENCRKQGVPVELHIFPYGGHGIGTAEELPHIHQWTSLLKNWLKEYKFI